MKKLLIILCLLPFIGSAQIVRLLGDSVKMYSGKVQGNELILENSTRTVQGFLYNYSATGRSRWQRPTQLNDTTIILGIDTFRIHDPEVAGGGISTAVDSIWRTIGKDSIQFSINGRYHSIKDSTGAVADTNFIRNQYTHKETKNSWYDSSKLLTQRFGQIYFTNPSEGISLDLRNNSTSYVSGSFPNYPTNARINFDASGTGGSGTGSTIWIRAYDNTNTIAWQLDGTGFTIRGMLIGFNRFYPNVTVNGFSWGDKLIRRADSGPGAVAVDFSTVSVSNFLEKIAITPALVSGVSAFDVNSTVQGSNPYSRMTTAQRDAIAGTKNPGLGVFCLDCTANDATTGVQQIWNGSAWKNCW